MANYSLDGRSSGSGNCDELDFFVEYSVVNSAICLIV